VRLNLNPQPNPIIASHHPFSLSFPFAALLVLQSSGL
jgi:hypothetical protein